MKFGSMADSYFEGRSRRRTPPAHEGLSASELAFFLDVDGTLLEIAETPDAVVVDEGLRSMLGALVSASGGAVALVSGRSIGVLDDLFRPLQLPCAGLHGFERRSAMGEVSHRPRAPAYLLNAARDELALLLARYPELLLEDKRFSLALHYRQAPHLEALVNERVGALADALGPQFELQRGRCVAEIRPAQANKATAVAEFMQEEPFRGRRPLCLGDDLTDEYAFEWVNAAGGLSIAVGTERDSHARAHLHSVAAARLWLSRLVKQAS
jgi:trehalose 6-phosphate phosphatase